MKNANQTNKLDGPLYKLDVSIQVDPENYLPSEKKYRTTIRSS